MARCGLDRIDDLCAGTASAVAIGPGDNDKESVGVVQDFLTAHGHRGLPNLLASGYGTFGPLTAQAVQHFCAQQGLPVQERIDSATLRRIIEIPAATPIACRGYLTLVLGFEYIGLTKVLSVTAQMEGSGQFGALNLNTDGAGLSFGLIQWAQRPGRLADIIQGFCEAGADDFARLFGDGNLNSARGLLAHVRKPNGGVDPANGQTTDAHFDLIREPWVSRFRAAAAFLPYQKVQVATALAAFERSYARFGQYARDMRSERSVGFMLDLANQFGDGGAKSIYQAARRDGMSEPELMRAIAAESVRRIKRFKAATRQRRQSFMTTAFLSDDEFVASPGQKDGEPRPSPRKASV